MTAAMPEAGARILVVDDDDRLGRRLVRALCERGYEAEYVASAAEAQAAAEARTFDHAVIDLRIGQESGLDVLRALLVRQPDLEATMLTGYGSIATAVDAMRLGAVNYLQKPADVDMVLAALARGAAEPMETALTFEGWVAALQALPLQDTWRGWAVEWIPTGALPEAVGRIARSIEG